MIKLLFLAFSRDPGNARPHLGYSALRGMSGRWFYAGLGVCVGLTMAIGTVSIT